MKLHTKNLILSLPILITILVMSFSLAKVSYAVPVAPNPICAIDATVLTVQKVKTNIAGLGNPPREDFYYYAVKLKIQNSSVYQQEGFGSCDSLINLDQDSKLNLTEYDKAPIKAGQKINAKIRFGGDEWFNGYFLSDIRISTDVGQPKPPPPPVVPPVIPPVVVPPVQPKVTIKSSSEISAMLVEQKQLNAVDDIALSSDEQQYTARGYRDAKFIFFIPVSVKVELKINAVNGNIEQVKKSWWAFLVRY